MKFFEFNEDDYNYFVKKCMLKEEFALLLKLKIMDYSRIEIARKMGYSPENIDKMVAKLRRKIKRAL